VSIVKQGANIELVRTLPEHCRMCYTCVRECPAKAIRIEEGQAEVVASRCIGCGNCVRVCTQRAKAMYDSRQEVNDLLAADEPVAAVVAPSFPAEFSNFSFRRFVGMVRALGFDRVNEVAFGADLVADRYRRLLDKPDGNRYIATSCPAIVAFVERYHPALVDSLAPIVSPMVATARMLRHLYGDDMKIVFIGPCIAKKGELVSEHLDSELDAGLTFRELRMMFEEQGITPDEAERSEFDPPDGGPGALFAISRGLLQAASIEENLVDGRVVAADGRSNFVEAIKEFETGHLEAKLLEALACSGCINGPGFSDGGSLFSRRNQVSRYVRDRIGQFDWHKWRKQMQECADLDLGRGYEADDQRIPVPSGEELQKILARLGKARPEDELNCGACGYETCREHAIAIFKGLAESEMCLPYSVAQLRETVEKLAHSNKELGEARDALVQSEKLASMGQLAAGIAHELNNPLGVVLMYAHILLDEADRIGEMGDDVKMIAEQADRCKKIVGGLLHFARQNRVDLEPVDIREVIDRSLSTVPFPEGVRLDLEHHLDDPVINLDRDQMIQVITNLAGNAVEAMQGEGTLTIRTETTSGQLKLRIQDTGCGISEENLGKIFEPFFTTKDIGKGTGLGLAVIYGIVKMHRGDIQVASNDDPAQGPTGTTFTVSLPR
jgi:signal transduction histidine kinase/Fe-S-cluster-containing hydrogenase component 2